jgi:cellulose synthase/poly-beta-1,6-N-acetylglucosamine synthase-like glycosyltransferase
MTILSTALFLVSVFALVYVIAGYPLLLALLARFVPKPAPQKDALLRTVSIVIAARNGEKFLDAKLRSILELNYPRDLMQIIVVSDGSTDRTADIVQSFASEGVEFHEIRPSGKSAAVNLGISFATGEILILTDIRQTLDPESLRNVVACFGDPTVGAVSGELSIRRGLTCEEDDTGLYWKYEVFIRKHMSALDSTFGTNGPFYALRRSLAVHIPPDTLLDDVYLPLAAFFRGYRLIIEPSAKAFDYPTNLTSEFKRKVRTQAGLYQILRRYPQLLSPRNRMRFHFISAKFARLLLPFFLILVALSSFGLPEPWMEAALAAQALFYSAALFDLWLPQNSAVKSITSPVRTFVVLMAASLMACKILFTPARELWKETKVRLT